MQDIKMQVRRSIDGAEREVMAYPRDDV